jgi:hypothetical protein
MEVTSSVSPFTRQLGRKASAFRPKRKGEAASRTCHDEGLAIGSSRPKREESFSIHGRAMRPRGAWSI